MHREVEGYVTEVAYNFDYYPEISPAFLRLAVLSRSLPFPSHRPLRYLEVGFGGGASLNVHSAASPGEYWGTDVNSAHADGAASLAASCGSGLTVLRLSFADLLELPNLPQFDVIAALGVWSWVSGWNRKTIVELLRKHLVEGGIFCMSSLALPANAEIVPLQRLLRLHLQASAEKESFADRLDAGIDFATALGAAGSSYFANPHAAKRLASIASGNRSYLVHEYLNQSWHPALIADTASKLSGASLRFVGGLSPLDHFDDLNFTPQGVQLLAAIDDFWLRETAKEYLTPKRLRFDVFIKQASEIVIGRSACVDRTLEFALVVPTIHAKTLEAKTPAGPINLNGPPFGEILDLLGSPDHRPKTLGEVIDAVAPQGIDENAVFRAIMIMVYAGVVHPAQSLTLARQAADGCRRLNEEILRRSLVDDKVRVLASPVTGGGVPVSRERRLFLLALSEGARTPDECAAFAWKVLSQGIPSHNGSDHGDVSPMTAMAGEALNFFTCLPVFVALQLIPGRELPRG